MGGDVLRVAYKLSQKTALNVHVLFTSNLKVKSRETAFLQGKNSIIGIFSSRNKTYYFVYTMSMTTLVCDDIHLCDVILSTRTN